jgi:ribosomal protein S18 acetylase RimI-like enzyme
LTELVRLGPDELTGPERTAVEELWLEVWPATRRDRLDEILPRHATRDGFRAVAAYEGDRLVGLAYGYLGGPRQWWHDRVASAMTQEQRVRWLVPGHFELAELMVRRDARRRGLGGALHDAVLMGLASPTALLSTQPGNEAALALYSGRGWEVVVDSVDLAAPVPYLVMGKELR